MGEIIFRMNQEGGLSCCAICNLNTQRRCARCLSVYYCNTEHQRQDWKRHRGECLPKLTKAPKIISSGDPTAIRKVKDRKSDSTKTETKNADSGSATRHLERSSSPTKNTIKEGSSEQSINKKISNKATGYSENSVISSVVYTNKDLSSNSKKAITYEGSSENEILSESAQQLSTEFGTAGTSSVLRVNQAKMPVQPEQTSRTKEYPEALLKGSGAPFSHSPNTYYMDPSDPFYELCQRVIRDMTQYGVCVLNNFLGKEKGQLVLNEVLEMYRSGIFSVSILFHILFIL